MGSGASLPDKAHIKRLNAKQCSELIGSKYFDNALFNELKDTEGFVTWEQLSEQWSRLSARQDCNTHAATHSSSGKVSALEEFNDGTQKEEASDTGLNTAILDRDLLATKRKELENVEEEIQHAREGMIAAARACKLDGVPDWKEKLDSSTERAALLSTEIHDLEELAWEPVMKGDTILFYYNTETGENKKSDSSNSDKISQVTAPARLRTSIKLGKSFLSNDDDDGRRRSARERALWHVLQKRSSFVKQFNGEWRECLDLESGYQYYVHIKSGHSQWEKPQGLDVLPATAEESYSNSDEQEGYGTSSTSDGWEAITSPEGDTILYYYNYLTGDWTHDCPDDWDRESYAVDEEGVDYWNKQEEVKSLEREGADCMKTVQNMIEDLKQIMMNTKHAEAFPVTEAVATTVAVEATPVGEQMFEQEPGSLAHTLENEYDSLLESLKVRDDVSEIEGKLEERAQIDRRRETLVHRASSNSLPALRSRARTMSIKPSTGRDFLMWSVLIKTSTETGKTNTGATRYIHDKTGRVFWFDDVEKFGAFEEPEKSPESTVTTI